MRSVHGRLKVWFAGLVALAVVMFTALPLAFAAQPAPAVDDGLDRTTPRRAFEGFRRAAAQGEYERAAQYLDLRTFGRAKAESDGPDLARDLAYVIDRRAAVDPATVPDVPDAGDAKATVTVASLYVAEEPVYINLTRVRFADGVARWQIARSTIAQIPELDAAFGPKPWEERMPKRLRSPYILGNAPWQWIGLVAAALVALALGRVGARVSIAVARRVVRRTRAEADDAMLAAATPALRMAAAILAFRLLARQLLLTVDVDAITRQGTTIALIFATAWLVVRMLHVVARLVEEATLKGEQDELKTRGLRTQLTILYRIASILVGVIALAAVLLQFQLVRSVGTSLLASAGVAGIVLGLAAQKSLGAIIAGVQLSLAQPVRIGDTVSVDGQAGSVEELHLTYVVVKLWDERRLIVPIGKFLDQSFENWSRQGTRLKGEVLLHLDFLAPIDAIRAELQRVCEGAPQWDGRVCRLQMTEATERGMTLRAVVSAADADALWDLRCLVRERLVGFVATLGGGRHLVRARSESVSSG